MERAIGEVGHKIHSKKAPFANLANIIFERELVKTLLLYYPALESSSAHDANISKKTSILKTHMRILKHEQNSSPEFHTHIQAICNVLDVEFNAELQISRWGKFRLPEGSVLRS